MPHDTDVASEPTDAEPTRRRRWPRRLAWALLSVVLVLALAAGAIGWYYADELLLVRPSEPDRPLEIVAVTESSVTLVGEPPEDAPLTGLEWDGGYARVGAELARDGDAVERELIPYPDLPEVGAPARLHFYASPLDLASVSDLPVEEITFATELGPLSATYAPGDSDRWVIFIHGRGATRAEAFRLLPAVSELGHPAMAISYRNDDGEPADPDGEYGLGWTESADVEAAVDHALAHGAADVVLVGFSMGGAIVGNYLRTAGDDPVAGVVYDSPVLSWSNTLDYEASNRGLPTFLTPLAAAAVRVRTGISFAKLDQVRSADELSVPVLLFHGTGDRTVPVTSSDEFAAARPDLVTYVRPEGIGHVQAWNADPDSYVAAVADFLRGLP